MAGSRAAAGPARIRATRSESPASGQVRPTGTQPCWRIATLRLNTAAPTLINSSRPDGSMTSNWRVRSAYTSTPPFRMRNRHGWLLCSDGAATAAWTQDRRLASDSPSDCGVQVDA